MRCKLRLADGLRLRACRSELADFIARAPLVEARQRMTSNGRAEIQPRAPRGEMVEEAAQRELRTPGGAGLWRAAALLVKGARSPAPRRAPLKVEGAWLVEVGTAWKPFGDAWGDLGGQGRAVNWGRHLSPTGTEPGASEEGSTGARWARVSLSEDLSGREAGAVAALVASLRPGGVPLDAPNNCTPGSAVERS